jgi:hypothetical protein
MTVHRQTLVAQTLRAHTLGAHTLRVVAGVLLIAGGSATVGSAQQAAPAPAAPAIATKLVSPIRGEAEIGYMKPNQQRKGGQLITTIKVKNLSKGPIAGFKVDEFWYDKAGETVAGSPTFRLRKPLMPGEVVDVTLTVPINPKLDMNRNNYKFEHANGKIKATLLPKI